MTENELAIGRKVRANRDFSGVPIGTLGTIVEATNSWPDCASVAIEWNRWPGDNLRDWFSFPDLRYLDLVNAGPAETGK